MEFDTRAGCQVGQSEPRHADLSLLASAAICREKSVGCGPLCPTMLASRLGHRSGVVPCAVRSSGTRRRHHAARPTHEIFLRISDRSKSAPQNPGNQTRSLLASTARISDNKRSLATRRSRQSEYRGCERPNRGLQEKVFSATPRNNGTRCSRSRPGRAILSPDAACFSKGVVNLIPKALCRNRRMRPPRHGHQRPVSSGQPFPSRPSPQRIFAAPSAILCG